ncbi:unnamed protein product [Paramecium primaurelia]|uniref:Uncharacterized protein n=1 Tax=Paramecium primaurelia TaxID=5886 RepID=A0A8S1QM37_PARPR|nr:unnamed protein product [Paramecium primaurelia]CAD8117068.1 unnamed protein product [Paramecium primaurelia]
MPEPPQNVKEEDKHLDFLKDEEDTDQILIQTVPENQTIFRMPEIEDFLKSKLFNSSQDIRKLRIAQGKKQNWNYPLISFLIYWNKQKKFRQIKSKFSKKTSVIL